MSIPKRNTNRDLVQRALAQAQAARLMAGAPASAVAGSSDAATLRSLSPPQLTLPGYSIVREIHRGGQGVVYEARQESTGRAVALKLIRDAALATPSERARFDREARILAQLKHPNIVAIHDSGIADGHPFLVMDYIPGTTLDQYVAELREGGESSAVGRAAARRGAPGKSGRRIDSILRLFETICEAVNVAHLRGIIHRDLKPGNIRVDPSGQPHILDFGLAKVSPFDVLADSQTAAMTLTGQFVGSLPWSAPEQATGASDTIDVRTDVYALGVMLYQMLTSRLPYDLSGSIQSVLHRIVHAEPTPPRVFNRQIDDELETLILKCLAKDPNRRYQSAGDLARDIARYRAGEPIEAKRDSLAYVLRTQLRRYRWAVALAALFLVTVLGGLVATYGQWRRASEQRDLAQVAEAQARQRFDDVRSLAHVFLFDFSDQLESLPGATRARELLVQTAQTYLHKLHQEAGQDATLRAELVAAYLRVGDIQGHPLRPNLGDPTGALASYTEALALAAPAASQDESMREQAALASQKIAQVYQGLGKAEETRTYFHKSLEFHERLLASVLAGQVEGPVTSTPFEPLVDTLIGAGRLDDAEVVLNRMLDRAASTLASEPANRAALRARAIAWDRLGGLARRQNRADLAEQRYGECLRAAQQLFDADPSDARSGRTLAAAHIRIADQLLLRDDVAAALEHCAKTLEIDERLAAADPHNVQARRDLAFAHCAVGRALLDLRRAEEAIDSLQRAVREFDRAEAIDPTNLEARRYAAITKAEIAMAFQHLERFDEAVASFEAALARFESIARDFAADPAAHNDVARTFAKMGEMALSLIDAAESPEERQSRRSQACAWLEAAQAAARRAAELGMADGPLTSGIKLLLEQCSVEASAAPTGE